METNTIPFIIGNFMPLHSGHVRRIIDLKRRFGQVAVILYSGDEKQFIRLSEFFDEDPKVTVLFPCKVEMDNPVAYFNILRRALKEQFGKDKEFCWMTSKYESNKKHFGVTIIKTKKPVYPNTKGCRTMSLDWWDCICPPWRTLYTHKVLIVSPDPAVANELAHDISKERNLPKPPKFNYWLDDEDSDPYWASMHITLIDTDNTDLPRKPANRGLILSAADPAYIRYKWPEVPLGMSEPNWDKVFYIGEENLSEPLYAYLVNHGYQPTAIQPNDYVTPRNYVCSYLI